jgi:uncharacterized protein YndB with AHSA1/START domain
VTRRHAESVVVAAPPSALWALVADPTAMPRWSPTITAAWWSDDRSSFTGRNEQGGRTWETTCRVDVSEPEREFAFLNCGDGSTPIVRWGFELAPVDGGTQLTQTWEVLPAYEAYVLERDPSVDIVERLDGREAAARNDMPATLAAIKAEAELLA